MKKNLVALSTLIIFFCGCTLKPLYECKKIDPSQVFFNGFDENGIHCITKTQYDPQGFDKDGWNKDKVNIFSHSKYDIYGYDIEGYDKNGFHHLEKF